jgi:integrase
VRRVSPVGTISTVAGQPPGPGDYVFGSSTGGPPYHRNVLRRVLDPALETAGLADDGRPKFRWHDARHCFASILIALGCDVVFVSKQLGHADVSTTQGIYSHLFDAARHADKTRTALDSAFGNLLETVGRSDQFPAVPAEGAEVVDMQAFRTGGNWRGRTA